MQVAGRRALLPPVKSIGDMIAEGLGLSASFKENMFTIWGLAAMLSVIGHTLLSLQGCGLEG